MATDKPPRGGSRSRTGQTSSGDQGASSDFRDAESLGTEGAESSGSTAGTPTSGGSGGTGFSDSTFGAGAGGYGSGASSGAGSYGSSLGTGSVASSSASSVGTGSTAGAGDPLRGAVGSGASAGSYGTESDWHGGAQTGTSGGASGSQGGVQQAAKGVADAAKSAASGLLDQVRQTASTRVAAQKDRAAEGIGSVANAIRQAGDTLRGQNAGLASYVDAAVDELQRFADRIREKDPGEMMTDVEDFARQRPAIFLGGAFLLGLGLARFLKSSSERRRMEGSGYQGSGYQGSGYQGSGYQGSGYQGSGYQGSSYRAGTYQGTQQGQTRRTGASGSEYGPGSDYPSSAGRP